MLPYSQRLSNKAMKKVSLFQLVNNRCSPTMIALQTSQFSLSGGQQQRNNRAYFADRLMSLADLTRDKPAGMFNQMFHARVSFRDFFENDPRDEASKLFIKNWGIMRAYVIGADGMSTEENEYLKKELQIWTPYMAVFF